MAKHHEALVRPRQLTLEILS